MTPPLDQVLARISSDDDPDIDGDVTLLIERVLLPSVVARAAQLGRSIKVGPGVTLGGPPRSFEVHPNGEVHAATDHDGVDWRPVSPATAFANTAANVVEIARVLERLLAECQQRPD